MSLARDESNRNPSTSQDLDQAATAILDRFAQDRVTRPLTPTKAWEARDSGILEAEALRDVMRRRNPASNHFVEYPGGAVVSEKA